MSLTIANHFAYFPASPDLRFRTKTGKGRTIPLEDERYGKLQLWHVMNPGKRFIFGTRSDKPNGHFLEAGKESSYRIDVVVVVWCITEAVNDEGVREFKLSS